MKRRLIFFGLIGLIMVPIYLWTIAYMRAHTVPFDREVLYPGTLARVGNTDAYWTELTAAFQIGKPDTGPHPHQSELLLYEDGIPLGPAHSPHGEIRSLGNGRYSHWFTGRMIIMFSASDNSDPRTNGRVYRITDPSADSS
jgi:hypothetical protein